METDGTAKLRVSSYEILLPLPDGTPGLLAANGLYGAFDLVFGEDAELLRKGSEDRSALSVLSDPCLERLRRRGHLVRETEQEELENVRILSRIGRARNGRKEILPVIVPGSGCNFRCAYCFERAYEAKQKEKTRLKEEVRREEKARPKEEKRSEEKERSEEKKLPKVMPEELAEAIFRRLKQYREAGYRIGDCMIYGGEPLLEQHRKVLEIIARGCRELKIHADCITNGYYVDRFLELLSEEPFRLLQITVDGPREVQDARRFPADGSGSYEKIMENIRLLLQRGLRVQVRINVDRENLAPAMELPSEFESRGFTGNEGFSFYYRPVEDHTGGDFSGEEPCEEDPCGADSSREDHCGKGRGKETYRAEDCCEETHCGAGFRNTVTEQELYRVLCSHFGREKALRLSYGYRAAAEQIRRVLEGGDYPPLMPAGCGAEAGMLVFDPDGQLHTCWEMTGREEKLGTVDPADGAFRFEREYDYWRTRTVEHMEACSVCPYLMFCGGGCAAAAKQKYGGLFLGFCGEKKEIFDTAAPLLSIKQYQKNGELSLGRTYYDLFYTLDPADRRTLLQTNGIGQILRISSRYLTAAGIFS